MNVYTLNIEDRKKFILNYKIKNGNIIIRLASKEKYVIPYTEENEQKILERMKKQITENIDFERKAIKEYVILTVLTYLLGFGTFLIATRFIPGLISYPSLKTVFANIPTFVASGFTLISAILTMSTKEVLEDFRKNKLYLDKEEEINGKIKSNQNMLSNVSNKTKKIVEKATEDRPVLDINKMDKVSLQDLKQILENFKRDEEFDFDYEPKKLIRK